MLKFNILLVDVKWVKFTSQAIHIVLNMEL